MFRKLYKHLNPRYQKLILDYKIDLKPREWRPAKGHKTPAHPELYRIIDAHREAYRQMLQHTLTLKETFWSIREKASAQEPLVPHWNNAFLPGLDIVGIYSMMTRFKPAKYLEIGSGNSTKVAYKAKSEFNLPTELISIDPQPRAEIDQLADQIIRKPFECTDINIPETLYENDILFIDNSHRILPNSDSMVFYLEVLPRLRKGVIVHLHDIYLPYDYPQFMCDRFYSEQYGLAMYLLANPGKYQPLLPNYFISQDKELSQMIAPLWDHENTRQAEQHGGSFWFRIN